MSMMIAFSANLQKEKLDKAKYDHIGSSCLMPGDCLMNIRRDYLPPQKIKIHPSYFQGGI
jgi:hypothetical protein